MELIKFYLESIFYVLDFPTASDICSERGNITAICESVINFTLTYSFILLIFSLYMSKDLKKAGKFLIFSFISIFIVFFFADKILMKISNPASFGMEGFILSFYAWAFLISEALVLCLFYYERRQKVIFPMIALSLLFIFLFALFGRGTYEQYLVLTGSFGNGYSLDFFLHSDIAAIIIGLFSITLIYSLLNLAAHWVRTGEVLPELFFRVYPVYFIVTILMLISIISLPVGDIVNDSDVAEAKEYIDKMKVKVDKYYLENGEYPKFIEEYIDGDADNPWLLKRHEYFTLGVRGTYYFSRPHKYCFIFQNPSADFSYYSVTSTRDWAKFSETGDFGNVYLTMCDEQNEDESTLFANHFGMPNPDDTLTPLEVQFNAVDGAAPESREATRILHERILEESERDPEVLKYYKDNIGGPQY